MINGNTYREKEAGVCPQLLVIRKVSGKSGRPAKQLQERNQRG